MSSPTVVTFQPRIDLGGIIIAKFVLPQADGNAAATYVFSPSGFSTPRISMCSAIQPSSRAMFEAMRSAKHFLLSRALPPYPEPYDQISRVSGKCTMYLVSLQGHGTSLSPSLSGMPTECMQGTTRFSSLSISAKTGRPMRAMMRMLTTTYGESVSCTPMPDIAEPTGPMLKGSTYMVRPRIDPRNSCFMRSRITYGFSQLLVGPAASFEWEQMNVPASTSRSQRKSYSSCEPSTQ